MYKVGFFEDGEFYVSTDAPAGYQLHIIVNGQAQSAVDIDEHGLAFTNLPTGEQIGFHITDQIGIRIPYVTYGDLGAYGYRVLRGEQNPPLFVGQRANDWFEFTSFLHGYLSAIGGPSSFGDPEADLVTSWGAARIQRFQGNNGDLGAILVNNPDCNGTFQVKGSIRRTWEDLGGPTSSLGFPVGHERPADDRYYDFTGQPISEFQHGFISSPDDTNFAPYPYYPIIGEAAATFTDIGNGRAAVKVRGRVVPKPGYPNESPAVQVEARVFSIPQPINTFPLSAIGGNVYEGTSAATVPLSSTVFFNLQVTRVDDNKQGFSPANGRGNTYHNVVAQPGTTPLLDPIPPDPSASCNSTGDGAFNQRPKVKILKIWGNGRGKAAVLADVTDDNGEPQVRLSSNKGTIVDPVMVPWPSAGDHIYAGILSDVAPNDIATVTVTARDSAGLEGHDTQSIRIEYSETFGLPAGQCCVGGPVNTATGNETETNLDLVLPGRGDTAIVIDRTRNTQSERDGPFGRGSSFIYDMALEFVDNPLLRGVQLRYGDGHTTNFQTGSGARYDSVSPGTFDYMTREGSDYVLRRKDRSTYRFDNTGRLRESRDRNSVPISLAYGADGHIDTISDASGRVVDLTWENGHIVAIDAPEGKHLSYRYEGDLLRFFTDANHNPSTEYQYDPAGRLIAVIGPNGQPRIRQEFDSRGRVTWQIIGASKRNDFLYNDSTRTTTVTDIYTHTTTYVYDPNYYISTVTDALNQTRTYVYDAHGNLRTYTDRRGNTWSYEYDDRGNLTQRTDPIDACSAAPYDRDITVWHYNAYDQVITQTNALSNTWLYQYDERGNLLRTTDPDGTRTSATYDAWGQPVSITDALSRTTRLAYDTYGNLLETIDAARFVTRSSFDLFGREIARTDANRHTALFQYDDNDNLVSTADPKGRLTRLEYDANNLLTRTVNRRGVEHLYQYDPYNLTLVAERPEPNGRWKQYGYDLLNRPVVMTDTLGYAAYTAYDVLGRTSIVTDTLGAPRRYGYDPNGNLATTVDALGQPTTMVYDKLNRLHALTDATSHTATFCYDVEDRLVTTTGPRGEVTQFGYDTLDRLVTMTDPLGDLTRYEHDGVGNLTAKVDPLQHRTDYRYDPLDRLSAVLRPTLPDGQRPTTRFVYDGVGNTLAITSPRGYTTRFAYDENDNLSLATDPLGGRTGFTHDEEDNRLTVTDANGHTTTTTYNAIGLPIQVRDPLGNVMRLDYDAGYRLARLVDALGRPTTYEYDRMGRLIGATDALGDTTLYRRDLLGRVTSKADANGNATQYGYDAVGRLNRVIDALNGTTNYGYDEVGNLTTIADANEHTTSFGYTLNNQVISETNPLSDTWRYAYDPAGRLTRRVDALDLPISFEYDSNDQLTGIGYGVAPPEQPPVLFSYDLDGNQIGMCDGLGCTRNSYDPLNRPTSTTDWLGRTITRRYDSVGNLVGLTYPNGKAVGYVYDANDRLAAFTDPHGASSSYERNPLGQVTRIQHPNSTVATFAYDTAGRLTNIDNRKLGAPKSQSAYAYAMDQVGNRTRVTETRAAFDGSAALVTIDRSYQYDALNRLVRATTDGPVSDTSYGFDAVGNREQKTGTVLAPDPGVPELPLAPHPEQTAYSYNAANQMREAGEGMLDYNANGDRTHETRLLPDSKTEVTDYTYDREDRLVIVRKSVNGTVTMEAHYEYDGYGRRARKTVTYPGKPAELTTFLYDGLDIIGARVQVGHKVSEVYYYLAPSPLTEMRRPIEMEQLGGGKRYWFQSDGLDSVVGLTDERGELVSPFLYEEYGQKLVGKTDLTRFTYTAQYYDNETGLLHFYARYYDAARGVWLTQDRYRGVTTESNSLNRYQYVDAEPVSHVDLYGYTPDKAGVEEGYYEYSCKCGWIDWGHAGLGPKEDSNPAIKLYEQVKAASTKQEKSVWDFWKSDYKGSDKIAVNEHAGTKIPFIGYLSQSTIHVVVDRNLSEQEQKEVTLGILMELSKIFEAQQGDWRHWLGGKLGIGVGTSSSFSEEDLTSNLIGFYRVLEGFSLEDIRRFCGALGREKSLDILENYSFKSNETFSPRLSNEGPCGSNCPGERKWPSELQQINPRAPGDKWKFENPQLNVYIFA